LEIWGLEIEELIVDREIGDCVIRYRVRELHKFFNAH